MTVLLPSWPERFKDLRFRHFVEHTLRLETPAHIYPKICLISHDQMQSFEKCYGNWSEGLASLEDQLLGCRDVETPLEELPLSGQRPLALTSTEQRRKYADLLGELIKKLHSLVTVFPTAKLHDCQAASGDAPQVTLNNTNLGTF